MVAVSKKKGGTNARGAKAAWNICRSSLTKNKYMKGPYRKDAPAKRDNLKMTQSGTRRTMKHTSDSGSSEKQREFHKLWKKMPSRISGG